MNQVCHTYIFHIHERTNSVESQVLWLNLYQTSLMGIQKIDYITSSNAVTNKAPKRY